MSDKLKTFQKGQWLKQVDAELLRVYAITLKQLGESPELFFKRFSDLSPAAAVAAYGDKYNLTTRAEWERGW